MAFASFDPRRAIRTVITTDVDLFLNGTNLRVITVIDTNKNQYQIPIYLSEETKSGILKPLPLIEFGMIHESAQPQDIAASTRKHEGILDVNIYWTSMDELDSDILGRLISDKLHDLIRTNQCGTVPGTHFINVTNTGQVAIETNAKQVVFHRNMEIYVLWYDRP